MYFRTKKNSATFVYEFYIILNLNKFANNNNNNQQLAKKQKIIT